jgi:hypothetical protein
MLGEKFIFIIPFRGLWQNGERKITNLRLTDLKETSGRIGLLNGIFQKNNCNIRQVSPQRPRLWGDGALSFDGWIYLRLAEPTEASSNFDSVWYI